MLFVIAFNQFFILLFSSIALDTGRKLNVVLCTFNLRPVSTGDIYHAIKKTHILSKYDSFIS